MRLRKNAGTLLGAAARLRADGVTIRLVIAGGKKPEPFVRLAERLKLGRSVSFIGSVDPLPCFAAADAFIHPTWYDPCSLVTLEAAACGLPVITTRYNGASELMTEGADGFILEQPDDATSLAARMRQLLHPELRRTMGAAGRAVAGT